MNALRAWSLLHAPVATGVVLMVVGGAAASLWVTQLVAAGVGVALFFAARHAPRISVGGAWLLTALAPAALLGTLMAPGLDGVHRWIGAAGLRLHVSQLVMPTLLVFVAGQLRRQPALTGSLLLSLQLMHVAQPDAGQASAVAVAVVLLRPGKAVTAAVVALAGASWWRPDPLGPSAFVEDSLARAFGWSPWAGAAAVAALLAAAWALFGSGSHRAGVSRGGGASVGVVLAGYLLAAVAVACTERFPVPLLGHGASSVLGLTLALAVCCRGPTRGGMR